jgi:hypothetical protein
LLEETIYLKSPRKGPPHYRDSGFRRRGTRACLPVRLHDAVIRVSDEAGNAIETAEHAGDFKEW